MSKEEPPRAITKQAKGFHDSARIVSTSLVSVAGLFRDETLIQLQRELALLKDKDTWNEVGSDAIQRAIDACNKQRIYPVCKCYACYNAQRWDPRVVYPKEVGKIFHTPGDYGRIRPCTILKCFTYHAEKLDLTVKTVTLDASVHYTDLLEQHDSHFVVYSEADGWRLSFGAKFLYRNLHLNPDVPKLRTLKATILTDSFFYVNSVDYARTPRRVW